MAVASMTSSVIRLNFYHGDDFETGKPIYKGKNFAVKQEATPDQLLQLAKAISGLQQHTLYNVERTDKSDIKEG
ncbi:DUF1659 domain-containing protein [Virgibacillus soli]|uniref:DUF1659 domain-containing protein n=1 Tax=Paracerasibacillus soli TaxID=480284 RepID=A0ABU5CSS4_9BACI|nr:DUF1659 domain-containing protein [Virgibacillus soli]MDY0409428.1 DUF1659 domain-containing protein [Virgibacillus soli]